MRRRALPERTSFACGACHILAQAFLVFDHHGHCDRERYVARAFLDRFPPPPA